MQPLATNFIIWQYLRAKVSWALSVLPIGLMFSAFIPLFMLIEPLERAMAMPHGAPVKEQPNGWMWITLFLTIMVFLMLAGAALGWLINALIARTLLGWPASKVRDVFLYSRVPDSWYREPVAQSAIETDSSKRLASWAATRRKGRWQFVFHRGVLAWGIPMYGVMAIVPVLNGRADPTVVYLFSQACLWGISGATFGALVWHFSEKQFLKQHDRQEPCGPPDAAQ